MLYQPAFITLLGLTSFATILPCKLKTLNEPTKSDCYVLSVIDLKNGDMIKSSSIKLGGIRKSVIDEVFVLKDDPSNALFITRELLKSNALQLFYLNSID